MSKGRHLVAIGLLFLLYLALFTAAYVGMMMGGFGRVEFDPAMSWAPPLGQLLAFPIVDPLLRDSPLWMTSGAATWFIWGVNGLLWATSVYVVIIFLRRFLARLRERLAGDAPLP